jgi:tRNA A37 threonylcarbamoyladenosine synthetase subunit TsaC/SUA5/YrdC
MTKKLALAAAVTAFAGFALPAQAKVVENPVVPSATLAAGARPPARPVTQNILGALGTRLATSCTRSSERAVAQNVAPCSCCADGHARAASCACHRARG